jgi:hypothetical protein
MNVTNTDEADKEGEHKCSQLMNTNILEFKLKNIISTE